MIFFLIFFLKKRQTNRLLDRCIYTLEEKLGSCSFDYVCVTRITNRGFIRERRGHSAYHSSHLVNLTRDFCDLSDSRTTFIPNSYTYAAIYLFASPRIRAQFLNSSFWFITILGVNFFILVPFLSACFWLPYHIRFLSNLYAFIS